MQNYTNIEIISSDTFFDRRHKTWTVTTGCVETERGTVYTVHYCDVLADGADTDDSFNEAYRSEAAALEAVEAFRSKKA